MDDFVESAEKLYEGAYSAYRTGKWWFFRLVVVAFGLFSVVCFFEFLSPSSGQRDNFELVVLGASLGGILFPVIVFMEDSRVRQFVASVRNSWQRLDKGMMLGSEQVSLDTPLVRYRVVVSLGVVSLISESSFHRLGAGNLTRILYTAFSALFGWWFFGTEGASNTIAAIAHNLREADTTTLREILSE